MMDQDKAIRALAALAQEHRLAIFKLLVRHGPSGLSAGEIGEAVGISASNLSFHLKELDRAGLVLPTRQGRFIRYAISVEGMRQLFGFLSEDCCGGRPELCGTGISDAGDMCGPAWKLEPEAG